MRHVELRRVTAAAGGVGGEAGTSQSGPRRSVVVTARLRPRISDGHRSSTTSCDRRTRIASSCQPSSRVRSDRLTMGMYHHNRACRITARSGRVLSTGAGSAKLTSNQAAGERHPSPGPRHSSAGSSHLRIEPICAVGRELASAATPSQMPIMYIM